MTDLSDVTLAVLAGGAGRRMGGPKAWLAFEGEPIVARLHRRMDWPGPTILISSPGREHPPGAERFDAEICDPICDQGPLRGIHTALTASKTEMVAVVPVDMPWLRTRPLANLAAVVRSSANLLGACYQLGDFAKPLPAVLRRSLCSDLITRIDQGDLSVNRWLRSINAHFIEAAGMDEQFWLNLNEPKDL